MGQRKKILEGEEIEFDHFCRASRKYLISNVYLDEIEKCNNANVKQQRALYKQQNKENGEMHARKITVRDRLRQIKAKHIGQFQQIIKREQLSQKKKQVKQQKNKENNEKQQQKAQESKAKQQRQRVEPQINGSSKPTQKTKPKPPDGRDGP